MRFVLLCLGVWAVPSRLRAADSWPDALSQMPLSGKVTELNRTNCVELLLHSFGSNAVVKALIFMPGATDEWYMPRWSRADLTNVNPSLLDAVSALTNQTRIRATFRPPFLLLHTDLDQLEPVLNVEDPATADRIKTARFVPHALYFDRDWDFLAPILRRALKTTMRPWRYTHDSWHFYRHSFAAWNLTGWEALEAAALAARTRCAIQHKKVVFEVDHRLPARPDVQRIGGF